MSGTWGLITRITFEQRPGQFTEELPDAKVLLPGQTTPVNQTVTTMSDITYTLLSGELMYKQEVAWFGPLRLAVAGGVAGSYVLGANNRQVQDLITPENARFVDIGVPMENSGRRLVFYEGDIHARESVRYSLKAGVQGELGLFNNAWYMTPGIYYDYGLNNVTNAENWQLNSVLFMVDFRHAF